MSVKGQGRVLIGGARVVVIYDRLLHLLRLRLGHLSEPLALGAHDLAIAVSDQLLVVLKIKTHCNINFKARNFDFAILRRF